MGLQLHRKLRHLSYLLGLLFLSLNINALNISIDGVLDEKEWSEAREWTKYYESMPFSLAEPKHFQKVLIQEDEKGMYFGFINLQSKDSIRANKHERDDEMANADKCGLAIDFDGDGLTAYGFTVSADYQRKIRFNEKSTDPSFTEERFIVKFSNSKENNVLLITSILVLFSTFILYL